MSTWDRTKVAAGEGNSSEAAAVLEEPTETPESLPLVREEEAGRASRPLAKPEEALKHRILVLYDAFRPQLYRYIRSLHLDPERAEEIIQECFMRFTTNLLEGAEIENEQGWIVRVAHNLALDLLKRERKTGFASEALTLLIENRADPGLSPEAAYLKKEQFARMKQALSSMKPQQRQCFQLRSQGFHYKDIGMTLGISEQRAAFIVKQVAMRLAAICG